MNQEQLQQQISDLEKHWDAINAKLNKLRDEKIHETRAEEKFRLERLIAEAESECQEIEQQLDTLESQRSRQSSDISRHFQKNIRNHSIENPDTSILRILYTYYQEHPGDPEMSIDMLLRNIAGCQADAIQTELFSLKKRGWIGYELTDSGTAGLVWIEPKGIKIAKQLV